MNKIVSSLKNKVFFIWIATVIFSLLFFAVGNYKVEFNVALIGIVLMWMSGITFCFQKIKERLLLLFFLLAQFVFLIVRPVISAGRGEKWWVYLEDSELFAVRGVFLSLMGLMVGGIIATIVITRRENANKGNTTKFGVRISAYEEKYGKYVAWLSGLGYLLTWGIQIISGIEKIVLMQGKDYLEFYVGFESKLPYAFIVIGSMMKYFLCIYLATRPVKWKSFVVLIMYVVSTLPDLIVGIRNPFVLACIFSFLYYCIRDIIGDKEKWIGRKEKAMTIIALPLAIVFLSVYTFIRNGTEIALHGIGQIFANFFYGQGVSFDVLAMGYGAIPYLPQRPGRNYTFGGIIDYFTHGSIGQILFGNEAFPDGNCMINALERNSFAHNMSYIACGEKRYLAGNGLGSSYVLETYTDFGYIGVIIFSIVMGILLVSAMKWVRSNILTFSIILVALTMVFFTPRAESTGWIEFLLYIQFWLPVIACLGGAFVVGKLRGIWLAKK